MTRKTLKNNQETPSSSTTRKPKKTNATSKEAVKSKDKKSTKKLFTEDCQHIACSGNVTRDNINFVDKLLNIQRGKSIAYNNDQSVQNVLMGLASKFYPYKSESPFDRRVTSLTWHPTWPGILAAGSKGGEVIWWNINQDSMEKQFMRIPGSGPGGSITAMHFHREKPTRIYTASVLGKVMLQDFEGKHSQCFLDTFTWENWFSSLDIDHNKHLLVAGDTKGRLYLTSIKHRINIWRLPKQVHKGKISQVQFHPLCTDLLATSSIDHTVKLWDMRKMESLKDCLCTLPHNKAVNSASFNPSSGSLMLTTDQQNELRIFAGPSWGQSSITIPHPHRQFQHLTPIKASWHPCTDVVVVGRYPDDNFQRHDKRSIDFFDGRSGKLQYQLLDGSLSGIVSLNQFNPTGDVLASGMGFHVIVWKPRDEDEVFLFRRSGHKTANVKKKTERAPSAGTKSQSKRKVPSPQKKAKLR